MKLKILTIVSALGLLLGAAAVGGEASQAAGKPGFVPGTWIGTGTISGSSSDAGVIGTKNSGKIRFTLVVSSNRVVSGSGTWKRTMTGAGFDTKSVIVGTASLKFSGPSHEVRFVGKEYAQGKITAGGVTVPMNFSPKTPVDGALVVTRAGNCTANGTATIPSRGPGLKLKWTAERTIKGTCNA